MEAYGVNVHLFCPGTIETPGYEEENKMKPAVTKSIEGNASSVTAEKAAQILMYGMKCGHF